MAKKEVVKKDDCHCCGLYCGCGHMSGGHMLVKIFLALTMVALVLSICLVFFQRIGKWAMAEYRPTNVMRGIVYMHDRYVGEAMPALRLRDDGNVSWKQVKEAPPMPERVYGNILKVEKNQITIYNNAAEEQIILSLMDTVITVSSTETGISALAPGQDVVIIGTMNNEDVLEAKIINVQ